MAHDSSGAVVLLQSWRCAGSSFSSGPSSVEKLVLPFVAEPEPLPLPAVERRPVQESVSMSSYLD